MTVTTPHQATQSITAVKDGAVMGSTTTERVLPRRRSTSGVARLVRRLERERRDWARPEEREIPTAQAWRAGVAEGLRLAQIAIQKGV
jgi:hypothetical protein